MADRYDEHILYLQSHPGAISPDWSTGYGLFKFLKFNSPSNGIDDRTGCLTMIRNNVELGAYINGKLQEDLTQRIRKDERIPMTGSDIRLEDLPVFAEYQREFDQMVEAQSK